MKSYIVLRNNQESGPYTLAELRSFGLTATDLIWIEGESTSWLYPTEIKGLKTIANNGVKKRFPIIQKANSTAITLSTNNNSPDWQSPAINNNKNTDAIYFPERASVYPDRQRRNAGTLSLGSAFFGFIVLLVGVSLCAFVVKRMVDGFGQEFSPTAEARPIQEETIVNTSSHTAQANNLSGLPSVSLSVAEIKKDSIQLKHAAIKPVLQQAVIKEEIISNTVANTNTENITIPETSIAIETKEETPTEKPKEEKKDPPKASPSLRVAANDYSVGLFGGISNLELSISNPSSQSIDRATVEVEYLKPNGNVVKTQTVAVENISPGGSKKIAVPPSNRGVKVRYKVVNVQLDAKPANNDI